MPFASNIARFSCTKGSHLSTIRIDVGFKWFTRNDKLINKGAACDYDSSVAELYAPRDTPSLEGSRDHRQIKRMTV